MEHSYRRYLVIYSILDKERRIDITLYAIAGKPTTKNHEQEGSAWPFESTGIWR